MHVEWLPRTKRNGGQSCAETAQTSRHDVGTAVHQPGVILSISSDHPTSPSALDFPCPHLFLTLLPPSPRSTHLLLPTNSCSTPAAVFDALLLLKSAEPKCIAAWEQPGVLWRSPPQIPHSGLLTSSSPAPVSGIPQPTSNSLSPQHSALHNAAKSAALLVLLLLPTRFLNILQEWPAAFKTSTTDPSTFFRSSPHFPPTTKNVSHNGFGASARPNGPLTSQ
jgi:hypothetical protein